MPVLLPLPQLLLQNYLTPAFSPSLPLIPCSRLRSNHCIKHPLAPPKRPRCVFTCSNSSPVGLRSHSYFPHPRKQFHPKLTPSPSHASPPISQLSAKHVDSHKKSIKPKRVLSQETRQKISYSMMGKPKSEAMRAKLSASMKGRVPWNKGKKLSPEIRARMSEARFGCSPWNKGRHLNTSHREAIGNSISNNSRTCSIETRQRMRMARRRPGDGIVGGSTGYGKVGEYPLVDGADINAYVTLRRELRVWSDRFKQRNRRRPSLADIRRFATVGVVRKFEKYVSMRDQIRGLASDVYGSVNPRDVPVVPIGQVSSEPQNNNAARIVHVTKHGNPRLVPKDSFAPLQKPNSPLEPNDTESVQEDMWDAYDRPATQDVSGEGHNSSSSVGSDELMFRRDQLSPNDYRMIGKYRLMETMDINRFVTLRKQLEKWSNDFQRKHNRKPALSDAKNSGNVALYRRFCEYLDMRKRMSGLVKEVYGTEVDDLETLTKVNKQGKIILDALRSGVTGN